MVTFANRTVVALGEAMVELAPVGGGLYRRGFAGDSFNTAWHMAQLLGPRADVGYVSRVGQDSLSEAFVAEIAADGLNVAGITRDSVRTMGLYLIELDGAERSFHYWRNTSAARGLADDRSILARSVAGAGLICLSGITLAILPPPTRQVLFDVLADARQAGAMVAFDPNIRLRLWSSPDEIRAAVTRMLPLTDIALPSFDDEATHWGDATPKATRARFAAAGVGEVVVKTGGGPVVWSSGGTSGSVDTPPVTGIRDTTGAGDAFNAGYLAARLLGLPVARAIRLGQILAAEVICTPGARAAKDKVRDLGRVLDQPAP